MKALQWKIDNRALVNRAVRNAAADGLGDFAEVILQESNEVAPIEEGTLIRSGETDLDRDGLRASISYDTPYAVAQHEETEYRHDPGRKAKFLEDSLKSRGRDLGPFLRDRIRRVT